MLSRGYFETLIKRIKRRFCFHKFGDVQEKNILGFNWPVHHKTCKKCGKWKYLD